jgi:8-amino-7-oxononanoate synthase
LGLAHNRQNAKKAFARLLKLGYFAPKASQLVNGYSDIHLDFEEELARVFGFESCIIFGSGYLANLALAGNLPRRGDVILMDEEYHASGKVGVRLSNAETIFFKHNDAEDLRNKLKQSGKKAFVFVEGVYSMIGDRLSAEVADVADEYGAFLIIDEAHSVGTIGKNLLGIYDVLNLKPKDTHIKMGTFSKALGSYGAYVVCNSTISKYLQNRGSSIIYATAPSLFDTAFAHENFKTILKNSNKFSKQLTKMRDLYQKKTGIILESQIAMYEQNAAKKYEQLTNSGYAVGFIRPPTIKTPSLRITLRLGEPFNSFKKVCSLFA